MGFGGKRYPNLARRVAELDLLQIPNTTYSFMSGRELVYRFELSPTVASRVYTCELHVKPGYQHPEMIVVAPNLKALASGKKLPHIYPFAGKGTRLCLWKPKNREWDPAMKLSETYIAWTLRWLWYFEDWLQSGEWAGEGEHPDSSRRTYGVRSQKNGERKDDSANKI